jgi:peptide/nickel transport system substrate-binding protein
VESILGRGGMGVVYLATDLRLKRRIALKVLAPELAQDQAFRDRFVRESELAASLEDPNVVPIHEAGEAGGQLFIAMRYVEGTDLGTLVREMGPLDPLRTASIIAQVASALDAAHDRGLVHRDVKPANILIAQRDRSTGEHVYLTDFGLIRRMAHATSLTRTGQFMGTIDYVAPEQIRGQPVDGRADVYSLGCVLYECLAGRPPFASDLEVTVLYAHLEEPPPAVTAVRPDLPPAIDGVVAKAMAKRPEERFESAGALAEAAREALVGEASTEASARSLFEPTRTRRSGRRLLPVAAIVAVLAVLAATLPFLLRGGGHASTKGTHPTSIEADSVGLIDLHTSRLTAAVPVGSRPSAIAQGFGAVWVANSTAGTVSRIDPATRAVVQTIAVGGSPAGIATGSGAVWVTDSDGRRVFRINPATNTVVKTVPVGNGPSGIAVGDGAVWVANTVDDTVSRIDPDAGRIATVIQVGSRPMGVAVGAAVWVTDNGDGTVTRIDPSSNTVTAVVRVGNGPAGVAVAPDGVWVANNLDGTVSRIDPGTATVGEADPVGDGPLGVALGGGAVWVTNEFDGTVTRLDPATKRTSAVRVGSAPQAAVVLGGSLWVAAQGASSAHRGGTLQLVSNSTPFPKAIDPGVSYSPAAWQVLITTNDGLVAFKQVGGPGGTSIVPDLATSIPAPTNGGTTYTFQLRPGIRYSNGQPVKASDVRFSFERLYRAQSPVVPNGYYQGILGGSACAKDGATCDLSAGIVTDDAAGTVTFHLVAPDAEFLDKLALPFADVVPAGTPDPSPSTSVPATGPYMIRSYTPKEKGTPVGTLVLVRNPQFHEWSPAAQPDGYPDRIVWRIGLSEQAATTQVEQGNADYDFDGPPPDRLDELTTRFTSQVHLYPLSATYGMVMNTAQPPFDDVRVRQAVNYAVDRAAVVKAFGQALPTCQLIPPNSPGYRPFCPYTLDPTPSGTWTAPDLARAQKLVHESGTAGMKVTVWTTTEFPGLDRVARMFVPLLDGLGYRADMHVVTHGDYFGQVQNSATRMQIGGYGWFADYPAPSQFIQLVSCTTFVPQSRDNINVAEFCDHGIQSSIDHALELQVTDPSRADALWVTIDRQVTLAAPWVPVLNPAGIDFVSARVGNYEHNPQWGLLIGQLWVK